MQIKLILEDLWRCSQQTNPFGHGCPAAGPPIRVVQSLVLCPSAAAAHVVPGRAATAQDPSGPGHGDLEEDNKQEDWNGQGQDEGVNQAAQHRGADGQDEEAEWAGQDVEDEAVLRALAALLQRPQRRVTRDSSFGKSKGQIPRHPTVSSQTLMRALTTSISSSFILLITTWSSSSLTMFGCEQQGGIGALVGKRGGIGFINQQKRMMLQLLKGCFRTASRSF